MANAPIENAPTVTAPIAVAIVHTAEAQRLWTTEILLYPPSQTDAAQVPHDYRCRSTSSHRIAFRSIRDNPMCARHPFRSYDAHQMPKNSTTPLMIKRTDNPVKDLFRLVSFRCRLSFRETRTPRRRQGFQ